MSWRPKEGWDAFEIGKDVHDEYIHSSIIEKFVEAGADAILEALDTIFASGLLAFIPEKETINPEEAIRHLDDCMSETDKILWPECDEAHKIGAEAVRRVKAYKEAHIAGLHYEPMPGETEE